MTRDLQSNWWFGLSINFHQFLLLHSCVSSKEKLFSWIFYITYYPLMFSYFDRILNALTQALRSSGVDLSQASVSVQIDVGKRANDGSTAMASSSKVIYIIFDLAFKTYFLVSVHQNQYHWDSVLFPRFETPTITVLGYILSICETLIPFIFLPFFLFFSSIVYLSFIQDNDSHYQNNQVMAQTGVRSFNEDSDRTHKRLRTELS